MSLDEQFEAAVEAVRKFTKVPEDSDLLELYALYKQATTGNVNMFPPSKTDLKARAKWDSWNGKQGMSKDEAKEAYVTITKNLKTKYA